MLYLIPDYYSTFQCVGGICPSTCCGGWQISIDPASLKKYRKISEPLRSRLENEIDWKHACFRQYDDRCAFLNEENLCDLYLEGGGTDAFCRACRIFPRHVEEFPGRRELSLSLSCPIAARMILQHKNPVQFFRIKKDKQEKPDKNFDFSLFAKLLQTRSILIHIIQNRQKPFSLRAAISLALAHDLQQRIDRRALSHTDRLLQRYSSPKVWQWFENRLDHLDASAANRFAIYHHLFSIFRQLKIMRKDGIPYLRRTEEVLHASTLPESQREKKFDEFFTDQTAEQLFLYFIFIYFCGSAYHGNAFGEMKFCFISVILIRELSKTQWIADPDAVPTDIITEAAFRLSREIEHADLNKKRIDQILEDQTVWNLENLFLLL